MGAGGRSETMPNQAFMIALDGLTTAVYPHKTAIPPIPAEAPPKFNTKSLACLGPVVVAMVKLTVHVFLPYIMVGLFAAAALGLRRDVCVALGVCLLAYLCLCEPTFGAAFLRHHQVLPPGLHCRRSPRSKAIISMVPALQYPHYKSTPWILGGDMATIFPFLAFKLPQVEYARRWVAVNTKHTRGAGTPDHNPTFKPLDPVSNGVDTSSGENETVRKDGQDALNGNKSTAHDESSSDAAARSSGESMFDNLEEAVALDLALPETGMDSSKPFYLVLHGLNGGSAEAYVLDFTAQALKRGCGVCVMIARGCMGTPVRGSELFHGARTSDVADVVRTLRLALPPVTPLCMVGYSMGAIIATNYAAISGEKSGLACCVSMSGSFDTRTNMTFQHSLRLWQPILAVGLKENFVSQHTRKAVRRGVDLSRVERCRDVVDFDTHMVAPYNGYANVTDYYIDMSAAAENKIRGLETPLLAVSALDDPITTARGSPIDDVRKNKYLYILLTRNGGHVGWPVGWLPIKSKWRWMSSTSLDFCEAVVATASIPSG